MIRFGADRLAADPSLLGGLSSVALATSDAARSAREPRLRTRALLLAAGVPIVRLFSPEHGLTAAAADGAAVADGTDPLTGLPVASLYGERFAPTTTQLEALDAVLFDVPDVGARCYTYAWTLTHLVDACAHAGVPLVVLDRPNPLGAAVEGPILEDRFHSFIGRHSIPLRHGLTLGELALLWRRERSPGADVRVLPCEGWSRTQLWPDTGLEWVQTSPAIACFDAALLYPGLVLFEATNLSVGRGTPHAFRAVGAPWLDAPAVIARMARRALPGITFEATSFTPATDPYAGMPCPAICVRVTHAARVQPVALGIALLAEVAAVHRSRFAFALYPTAVNPSGAEHLERLAGSGEVRTWIARGAPPAEVARLIAAPGWRERIAPVELYPAVPAALPSA